MKKQVSLFLVLVMVCTLFISSVPLNASAEVNYTSGTVFNSCDKEITTIPSAINVPGKQTGDGGNYPGYYELNTETQVEGTGCYSVDGTESSDYVRLYVPYGDAVEGRLHCWDSMKETGNANDYGLQLWMYSDDFTTLQNDDQFKILLGSDGTPEIDCYNNVRWYLKTNTEDSYQDYALQNGKWNLVVLPISLCNVNEAFIINHLKQVMIGFKSNVTLLVDDLRIVKLSDVGVDNVYSTDASKYVLQTRKVGVDSADDITFDQPLDASEIAERDAALLTWIYVDGLDAMKAVEGGLNLRITSDGTAAKETKNWNLNNYPLTDKKWNLVALPFKESADYGLNKESINYLQVFISEMPENATVEVKDAEIINFTTYLYEKTGIIFYDGYEKETMLWSGLSTDSVFGASSVILKNNFANEHMHVAEYKQENVKYPILTENTPLDFSAAGSANNIDCYYSIKLVGNLSDIKCNLSFSISSGINGDYLDHTTVQFILENKDMLADGKWHRFSTADKSLRWQQKADGIDLSKIQNMRFFLDNTDGSYQYLIDNLMIVNRAKYGGTENIYIVKTTDYNGSNVVENYKLKSIEIIDDDLDDEDDDDNDDDTDSETKSPETGDDIALIIILLIVLSGGLIAAALKKKTVK